MHPLFSAALSRPDLIANHAANYAALFKHEVSSAVKGVVLRAVGFVVAAISFILALSFTGIAVMLGSLHGFAWALVLVPGSAFLLTAIGVFLGMRSPVAAALHEVRSQFDADLAALKIAGGSNA